VCPSRPCTFRLEWPRQPHAVPAMGCLMLPPLSWAAVRFAPTPACAWGRFFVAPGHRQAAALHSGVTAQFIAPVAVSIVSSHAPSRQSWGCHSDSDLALSHSEPLRLSWGLSSALLYPKDRSDSKGATRRRSSLRLYMIADPALDLVEGHGGVGGVRRVAAAGRCDLVIVVAEDQALLAIEPGKNGCKALPC
jgi:hypothetical protein